MEWSSFRQKEVSFSDNGSPEINKRVLYRISCLLNLKTITSKQSMQTRQTNKE